MNQFALWAPPHSLELIQSDALSLRSGDKVRDMLASVAFDDSWAHTIITIANATTTASHHYITQAESEGLQETLPKQLSKVERELLC